MWSEARLAQSVSSFGVVQRKTKRWRRGELGGGCVESGSVSGGEFAQSKDTADPSNWGTS